MTTRRKVLKAIGIGAVTPSVLVSQEHKLKRSRWDLIFGGNETKPASHRPDPNSWKNDTITVAWIGHSTVLINFFGTHIITDPVFSSRIGVSLLGLATFGPRRLVEPALKIKELPPIDLILLSHAHMDHLDIPSLEKFDKHIPVVMAKNTSDVIDSLGKLSVTELDWGEKTVAAGIEITAIRVKHFGWRYPWETDRSRGNWNGRSYNAYLLTKNGRHIFFGGDTALQEYFKSVDQRKLDIALAMMPIGAYDPWIFNHCNPEQAVAMADDIGAKVIVPMHWGTFIQSDEPTEEPIARFKKALADQPHRIALEAHGQTWLWKHEDA